MPVFWKYFTSYVCVNKKGRTTTLKKKGGLSLIS